MNKGGYSSNCKIVPVVFLHLMAKYTLPFSKPVKSDRNEIFWYFWNNYNKTTKIFWVRSSPVRQFWKNCSPIQYCSAKNWLKSWSSPIQSWSVLISGACVRGVKSEISQVRNPDPDLGPNKNAETCRRRLRCQAKFLTSAKFLTCYCFQLFCFSEWRNKVWQLVFWCVV